jgi:predicted house-cleaning noncanonical NTP pyrophosphatase (MazG superfamily)
MKRFVKKLVKRIKKEMEEYMTSYKEVELAKIELVKDGARALKSTIMDKKVSRNVGIVLISAGIGLVAVSFIN